MVSSHPYSYMLAVIQTQVSLQGGEGSGNILRWFVAIADTYSQGQASRHPHWLIN